VIALGRAALLAGALALAAVRPAAADPAEGRQLICQAIGDAAAATGLPFGYLARLLWTESGFRSSATSPAGALGVAQFMPQTAALHGLADPRDPFQSIPHAAVMLVGLYREFGNLGLAAAAYNAGEVRIAKWLRGLSPLPIETRLYVLSITGRPIEDWIPGSGFYAVANAYPMPGLDCLNAGTAAPRRSIATAAMAGLPRHSPPPLAPRERVWAAQLDSHLVAAVSLLDAVGRSEDAAAPQALPPSQRNAAQSLCATIRVEGASCQVVGGR
jgi:hypothetical protein